MCGIAGFLSTQVVDRPGVLKSMAEQIRHRGPDGVGTYDGGLTALAHTRLSIIDVDGGSQPLSNEDGTVWLTFNGEIYNFKELRVILEGRNHQFKSATDSEVIVHAYEEWGLQCFEKLRGMFAIGIWDATKNELVIARDRLGIKPIVYCQSKGGFAFASEIQALTRWPGFDSTIDQQAIDLYLFLQYIPQPFTAYKSLRKLPPASYLIVSSDGACSEPIRYWELKFQPDTSKTLEEWTEEFDHVLRDSVRVHTVSDVPFGAFLSGGLDSSTVVSYMSSILPEPVRTFSIRFEESEFDESPYARAVAKQFGTQHFEATVSVDAIGILPKLVRHYGEPFADSSAVPTYYVSQLASEHVKMVLSGDGGDETLAGYHSYANMMRVALGPTDLMSRLRFQLGSVLRALRVRPGLPTLVNSWSSCIQYFSAIERRELWINGADEKTVKSQKWMEALLEKNFESELCSHLQHVDINSYLPNDILNKVDIASMCHGLEVRVPLLDHKVVEFLATVPSRFKWKRGSQSDKDQGKLLLKNLVKHTFDKDFIHRRKQGFEVPIRKWFKGEFNSIIREKLLDSSGSLLQIFDRTAISNLVDRQNQHGGEHHKLWSLLFLNEWLMQSDAVTNHV